MEDEIILYILVRNDLQSLNVGKAMAQVSHATSYFTVSMEKSMPSPHEKPTANNKLYHKWRASTPQHFGTVLVLTGNQGDIAKAVTQAGNSGHINQIIVDTTYPYQTTTEIAALIPEKYDTAGRLTKNNITTLYRAEWACGFIFGLKSEVSKFVKDFPLHP